MAESKPNGPIDYRGRRPDPPGQPKWVGWAMLFVALMVAALLIAAAAVAAVVLLVRR